MEIKSFIGVSQLYDFYMALGQFNFYNVALEKTEPNRSLFLAVPEATYKTFFRESITVEVIQRYGVRLIVYDVTEQKITVWKR